MTEENNLTDNFSDEQLIPKSTEDKNVTIKKLKTLKTLR